MLFSLADLLDLKAHITNGLFYQKQIAITRKGLTLCPIDTGSLSSPTLDINECGQNNGGCDRFCNNTDGSFFCTCGDGYNLNEDGRRCDGKSLGW